MQQNTPKFDISDDQLKWAFSKSVYPEQLDALITISRKNFGWFVNHIPRCFEYPWCINQIGECNNKMILDFGAGISPLPIFLAESGASIITVDNHKTIRKIGQDPTNWNPWGFLDYSYINNRIKSFNLDLNELKLSEKSLDVVYSISVIEHIKAIERRRIWHGIYPWLKEKGFLILTIDLVLDTENIWNFSEGIPVEQIEKHGTLETVKKELSDEGFELLNCEFVRRVPKSRTDCVMLKLLKS